MRLGERDFSNQTALFESRTLAELTDIRSFGTVSLLDLLCVVESALSVIAADAAADIAGVRPEINAMTLPAWGTRGVPIVPALFRAFFDGEPAPPAVQLWLGNNTVTLDQLDEQIWRRPPTLRRMTYCLRSQPL